MCSSNPPPVNSIESWSPSVYDESVRTLNLPRYATYYFTVIANRLSNGASKRYLREFGVGVAEWRVMAMLSIEPHIPASRICQVIGLDKSAVSRAVTMLHAKGYLTETVSPHDERRKTLDLTEIGKELHKRMIDIALDRERSLLQGFSREEKDLLLEMLRRILDNTVTLNGPPSGCRK